ncbi:M20/M25/M40 family metallo-hydrolase [Legionella shakespearei]|uniref:Leucine aminopeptidase n=1 Tax=Legionella shakespearei DSM 23087 TaxID=1122169 RepID=A0A0W0YLY8_9GAMM|nr:M20/M25/M40 family metallo-hydrolase [Legionella shakespearei]KTD57732.1 leucine aminopeptidase [Legionella shakespearei DSM 23087]
MRLISMILLSCFTLPAMSQSEATKEQLIVSNCKYEQLKQQVRLIEQSSQYSLIEASMSDDLLVQLHENKSGCGKFLNSEPWKTADAKGNARQQLDQWTQIKKQVSASDYSISHEAEVGQLYKEVDPNKIWQTNQHLTSYMNRSATKETGVAAAAWFKQQFDTLAREYGRDDVDSYLVQTGKKYIQPSVVTLIGKGNPADALVIGAHIDTLDGNMPGADDDSSGISVAMEMARVLLASKLKLDRPVYIIAYAAEERGLVGSGYVVQHFLNEKIPVKAVMQLDQAGYRANPKDNTIWLLTDYVDTKLNQFIVELLTHYVKIPVGYTRCGYACSDHANWFREGFSTFYPSATTLDDDNPYIHTTGDKLDIINLDHMVNFTRLGLAFVAELGLK